MKKFILAALAASVVATPVLAAPSYQGHDNGRHEQRYDNRGHDRDRGQYDRRDYRSQRGGYQVQHRNWSRGDRFDYRYANNYRVISNPRNYRLHDAPRGYRWVQSGNDAVLIGLTTGLVAAVLANSIH